MKNKLTLDDMMHPSKMRPIKRSDGIWECGCVTADSKGRMTSIKFNSPYLKKCPHCHCVKPKDTFK